MPEIEHGELITRMQNGGAIAGHHAGLPDREGESGSLRDRLSKVIDPLDPVWQRELSPDSTKLMPQFRWERDRSGLAFQLGFLGRMIFSCLVDADFLDTEAFYSQVEGRPVDRAWPKLPAILDRLLAAFDAQMPEKRKAAGGIAVNRLRNEILTHVRAKAEEAPGIFTLTVPTGGGKTLASLGFALDHVRCHGLDRIVYAIPFTSIIDQTAEIFRNIFGADIVLEHHFAIDEERARGREGAPGNRECLCARLATGDQRRVHKGCLTAALRPFMGNYSGAHGRLRACTALTPNTAYRPPFLYCRMAAGRPYRGYPSAVLAAARQEAAARWDGGFGRAAKQRFSASLC
jgi:hypothetical protein